MRYLSALLAVLSLFAFSGQAEARKAELRDPDPVAIPSGVGQDKVVKDIKRALVGRGWAVTSEQPGQIDSTLNLREHVARIRVTYDAQQVRFAYVDSVNLDYKERKGKRFIHRNYLGWVGYLVRDLATNLQISSNQ